jgi:hypothetical protein
VSLFDLAWERKVRASADDIAALLNIRPEEAIVMLHHSGRNHWDLLPYNYDAILTDI